LANEVVKSAQTASKYDYVKAAETFTKAAETFTKSFTTASKK
jgi:hypothetical protein